MRRGGNARMGLAGTAAVILFAPQAASAATGSIWHMNEPSGSVMTDSGSPGAKGGNLGTLKNVQVGQPGFQGTGYGFTGKSVVTVKSNSSIDPGAAPFQFTLHVNFTKNPSSSVGDYDLLRKGLSSTKGGDFKAEILQSGKAICYFKGSSGSKQVSASGGLNDGKWHTIQCLKDDSKVTIAVDGKSKSSSAKIGSISNSAPLAIGAKAQGGDWYTGLLDEVSFSIGGSAPAPQPQPQPTPAPAPAPTMTPSDPGSTTSDPATTSTPPANATSATPDTPADPAAGADSQTAPRGPGMTIIP